MNEDQIIEAALAIIESRLQATETTISSPTDAESYLVLKLAALESEVFAVLFLNTRHQVVDYREMFYGTIDGTSVYPREVVRAVIETNAAAIILAHNHPSGVAEPSDADIRITHRLISAMELIDVRVLDHLVVGGMTVTSLASRGLM